MNFIIPEKTDDDFLKKYIVMMRIAEARRCFGLSRSHFYDQVGEGFIPPSVSLSKRAKGWPYFELEQVLRARISGKTEFQIKELVKKIKNNRENFEVED